MKTLSKKIISLFLALTMVLSVSIPALAMETQDNVTILQDDNNVRVARAYIDGELAVSTFYKQSGILTIESNGSSYTIQTKDTKNFGSTQKNNAPREVYRLSSRGTLQESESIHTMGYKIYYNKTTKEYTWYLDGKGYFNSIQLKENPDNERLLQSFKTNIDKSKEYWNITVGALIGAGVSGAAGIVLALLPEPLASKAAATAALTAAGISASAAVAAGGSLYVSSKYYKKAQEIYDRI